MLIYVLICTFCTLIAIAFCKLAWKRFKFCQVLSLIPGPKGIPIFGNTLQFKNDPHEYLDQLHNWCAKYKEGLFCIWYGLEPVVVIHSPEFAQVALPHTKNINKSRFYELFQPWIGTGILTSSGEKWKCRRKLLTSTFHFKILNSFTPVARDHAKTLVESLKKQCGKSKFDISPFITLCTLDVICETAMGVDIMAQQDRNSEYVETVLGLSEQIYDRLKQPWLWNDTIYELTAGGKRSKKMLEISHGFTKKIINDRINERSEKKSSNASGKPFILSSSNRKLLALLDLLLEAYDAGNIDKEGLREEVDTFLFEGHDTTASALLWTIHLVGKHPEVQAKLQQEADDFFDSIEDVITIEDLKQLEFIECVIKESMRLFPPAPFFTRRVDEEFHLGAYVVPKGAIYAIMTSMILRHPDHWEDPNVFKPERFLERNHEIRRHPYAYIPFSAGPRNCIGQRFAMMEMKIIISSIFHQFSMNATQETDKIRRTSDVLLRSLEGIWVEITARK